jgi:hypothetical protein
MRASAASFDAGALTPFDSARLRFDLPLLRQDAIAARDSARGNAFYLAPNVRGAGVYHLQDEPDSGRLAALGGVGLTVYGTVLGRVAFYTHALIYTEHTDKAQFTHQFDPRFGETYSVEKGAGDSLLSDRTFNRFEEYVTLDLAHVRLKAGRDRVRMGPGYFSSLMAGPSTPPYWLLEARIDFAPWLAVDDYLLRMTDTEHDVLKYANLHRYEFRFADWLEIAFQDIVIYQDRDPDWAYALPLVPLSFAEANNGGRDNAAMGFDFLCTRFRGLSFWGELFLDDLVGPGTFFDDFWENRWAALGGFQVASPWPGFDADLVIEYGHVEPWTYNGRKAYTSFRQFNVPSASKLGPDSRSLDVQLAWRPLGWLEMKSRTEWNEKGRGRGATLGAIHDDAVDGQKKAFLAGPIDSELRSTQSIDVIWKRWIAATAYWVAAPDRNDQAVGFDAEFKW